MPSSGDVLWDSKYLSNGHLSNVSVHPLAVACYCSWAVPNRQPFANRESPHQYLQAYGWCFMYITLIGTPSRGSHGLCLFFERCNYSMQWSLKRVCSKLYYMYMFVLFMVCVCSNVYINFIHAFRGSINTCFFHFHIRLSFFSSFRPYTLIYPPCS